MTASDLVYEVEQFLFREARILDAAQYDDWLKLLDKDCLLYTSDAADE